MLYLLTLQIHDDYYIFLLTISITIGYYLLLAIKRYDLFKEVTKTYYLLNFKYKVKFSYRIFIYLFIFKF